MQTAKRFLVVGLWNTAVGLAVVLTVDHFLGSLVHPQVVLLIAFSISVVHAYATQKLLVFRTSGSIARELPRFVAVNGVALATNAVLLQLLLVAGVPATVSQAAAMLATTVLSYLGHKHITFPAGRKDGGR